MSKPLFFFGAGAESDFGVVTGDGFRKPLLVPNTHKAERKQLFHGLGRTQLIQKNTTSIYSQTIYENEAEARTALGDSVVDLFLEYRNVSKRRDSGKKKEKYKDELPKQIEKYTKGWYDKLSSESTYINKDEQDKEIRFFLDHIVFFDALDAKFNALRYVDSHDYSVQRVANAYYTLFIEMLKGLYVFPQNYKWTLDNILNLLCDNNYTKPTVPKQSYYSILNSFYKNITNGDISSKCYVVTSNYTDLALKYTKHSDVIYLHGKMTWFEDFKHLVIYDCTKPSERPKILDNSETILPFILIPSGVKPLICKKQIDEFSKFGNALWDKDTKVAVVVGYRFNSEDNHINSMFSEWLRENGHTLIVLNYHSNIKWDKLPWTDKIAIKDVEPTYCGLQTINSEKWNSGILDIHVDKGSAIPAFETVLEVLKSQEEQK